MKNTPPLGAFVRGLLLLGSGLFLFWRLAPEAVEGLRSYGWPSVEGRLVSVDEGVYQRGGRRGNASSEDSYSGLELAYHYDVPREDGAELPLFGWRYDASSGRAVLPFAFSERTRARLLRLHLGAPATWVGIWRWVVRDPKHLRVFYDPREPAASVLRRGPAVDTAVLWILAAALILAGWRSCRERAKMSMDDRAFYRRAAVFALAGFFGYGAVSFLTGWFLHRVIASWPVLIYLACGIVAVSSPQTAKSFIASHPNLGILALALPTGALLIIAGMGAVAYQSAGRHIYWWMTDYELTEEEALDVLTGRDRHLDPLALRVLYKNLPVDGLSSEYLAKYLEARGRKKAFPASCGSAYALAPLVTSKSALVRRRSKLMLAPCGDAASMVADLFSDPDPDKRELAATFFPYFAEDAHRHIPRMITLLGDSNQRVRTFATRAMGRFGPAAAAAVPKLMDVAKTDSDRNIRVDAVLALDQIGPKALPAVGLLISLLKDPSETMKTSAANALASMGPAAEPAVPALKRALRDPALVHSAARALGEITGRPYQYWISIEPVPR